MVAARAPVGASLREALSWIPDRSVPPIPHSSRKKVRSLSIYEATTIAHFACDTV
jgi:hypothetical protein